MHENKALNEPNFGPAQGRIHAIDELRGLAILAVLASHIGLVFGSELASAQFFSVPALGVGVDLFFVISGFAIAESAKRMRWCVAAIRSPFSAFSTPRRIALR